MSWFKRVLDDYFDERAKEISDTDGNDNDEYDEANHANHPGNPIWDGSDIHYNPYGSDPTLPDPNELNQD